MVAPGRGSGSRGYKTPRQDYYTSDRGRGVVVVTITGMVLINRRILVKYHIGQNISRIHPDSMPICSYCNSFGHNFLTCTWRRQEAGDPNQPSRKHHLQKILDRQTTWKRTHPNEDWVQACQRANDNLSKHLDVRRGPSAQLLNTPVTWDMLPHRNPGGDHGGRGGRRGGRGGRDGIGDADCGRVGRGGRHP